jgi:hypothetical protein
VVEVVVVPVPHLQCQVFQVDQVVEVEKMADVKVLEEQEILPL